MRAEKLAAAAPAEPWRRPVFRLEFAGSADADPLVRMRVGDGPSIGYAVDGASAAVGQADGSVITYPDVRRDSDLELIAGSASVKETLILKDADAPTTWRFPLEFQGLTAGIDEHGSVVFADADGNQRRMTATRRRTSGTTRATAPSPVPPTRRSTRATDN